MDHDDYINSNRDAWDEVADRHKAANWDKRVSLFSQPGYASLDRHETQVLQEIGLQDKSVAHLCCNSGVELLSIKNLGARKCVGFDVSAPFIDQARELAALSKIDCQFEVTDIHQIDSKYFGQFDLVYVSVGALGWMPDVSRFFEMVAKLLRPKGHLFLYEAHPFLDMISLENKSAIDIQFSYFRDAPIVENEGLDYLGKSQYNPKNKYWFHHKMSDVITSVIAQKMTIQVFKEFPHDVSMDFEHLEELPIQLPLSYILTAQFLG